MSMKDPNLSFELIELGKAEERGVAAASTLGGASLGAESRAARRLEEIIEKGSWPTEASVGPEASKYAFLIALHGDFDAKFQKKCLEAMEKAYAKEQSLALKEYIDKLKIRALKNRSHRGRA